MPRSARVSNEELEDSSYIDDMLGEGTGSDTEVVEDKDAGTQETTDKNTQVRDGRQQTIVDDKGNQQQQQRTGKQPGKKDAQGRQLDAQGNPVKGNQQQQQQNGKVTLSREDQMQVYRAVQQRMQPVIDALDIKLKKADQELQIYRARDDVFKQYSLNPKEHLNAVQLAVALRDKPKETLEYLIGQAQANGLQIGTGTGQAPLSAQAISQMLDQRLAPLTRQRQEQEARTESEQAAQQELTQFFGKYPDARVHTTAIDEILKRNPQLNLVDAYVKLRSYYGDNQLDWNIPLETHYAANGQQQQQQQRTQNGRPLNVRGVGNSIQNDQENAEEPAIKIADVGTSTRNIIRNAMRGAGLDISKLN